MYEVKILRAFHDYCAKYGLKYYLIGGALLGSVRYGGFIPWDDDIDVAMFREDYERLRLIWDTNPIEGYFLQHNKSDPKFARGIMKLRLNETKLVEYTCRNIDMHHGIYIDIFPIDYVKRNYGLIIKLRGILIRKLLSIRSIKSGYHNGKYIILKRSIKDLFPLGNNVIDNLIHFLSTIDNNRERNYAIIWVHSYEWKKQVHEMSVFGLGSSCKFEGYNFIAPSDKESFLTKVFGENYLEEPPYNKRETPHKYIQIEFKE